MGAFSIYFYLGKAKKAAPDDSPGAAKQLPLYSIGKRCGYDLLPCITVAAVTPRQARQAR